MKDMKNIFACVLMLGIATSAFAGNVIQVPEIDGATAAGALTLVSGAVLVLRSRRNK
jgi:hypothetical protein